MMAATDMTLFLSFGFLLLAAYVGGGIVAWILSWESRRDRNELRLERQTLISENRRLSDEILKLKEEIIDMRAKLSAAVLEINRFTAVLDGRETHPDR
jgi:hypothetical protein